MKQALKELWRRPGRFITATFILTLIAALLMFLGGLLDGLVSSATDAVRIQPGNAIVFSDNADGAFVRSRITPAQRDTVSALADVEKTGGLGVTLLGARVPGNGPRDLANVAVWGYEIAPAGIPAPPADGEAWADDSLKAEGVALGDVLNVGPARSAVTVVGWVKNSNYAGQASLWTTPPTWRDIVADNQPGLTLPDDTFQAILVQASGGAGENVIDQIAASTDGVTALSILDAVYATPGVKQQSATFNQILGVTIAVALAVIALFFSLVTVERAALYGVLKAIGADSLSIFLGLITQAVVVSLIASSIAGIGVLILEFTIPPGGVPLEFSLSRLGFAVISLVAAAIAGCAFSLRRILTIDPASALGGT